jgi:hypothetical protein
MDARTPPPAMEDRPSAAGAGPPPAPPPPPASAAPAPAALALRRGGGALAPLGGGPGGPGLAGNALAAALPRSRPGDPLGLGARARPPPPPDPDPYDRAAEDAGGGRSLLSAEERAAVDAEGPLDIAGVRRVLAENLARTDEAPDLGRIDAEIAFQLDARIAFKVFLAGDNAYTREELYEAFPFHEFGTCPEAVFAPQLVGVFPPLDPADGPEFVLRDADDETFEGFCPPADLIRPPRGGPRAPLRVVTTKIFVGKERWDDFCALHRTVRGAVRVAAARGAADPAWLALGGPLGGGLLLLGAPPEAAGPPPAPAGPPSAPAMPIPAAGPPPAPAGPPPATAAPPPAGPAKKGRGPRRPAAAAGARARVRARARAGAARLEELEGRVARLELTLLRSALRALRPGPG